MKSAVIIKGNPELIANNLKADVFYNDLAAFLGTLGFDDVSFDPGEPYTEPKAADLWIGHSRGADRLRFAPAGTKTIGVGVPASSEHDDFPIVNNPDDAMANRTFENGKIVEGKQNDEIADDSAHYILTDGMKKEIAKILAH